jgi:hypothetical protein
MIIQIKEGILAEIVVGRILEETPTWNLKGRSIKVGPYVNGEEHERHYLATVGSGNWYWTPDEFRFNKSDRMLSSVGVRTHEISLLSADDVFANQAVEEGLIRLVNESHFTMETVVESWFEPTGKYLVSIVDRTLLKTKDLARLKVATDFELLFRDNILCGWVLHNCCCYLTEGWQANQENEPDSAFINLLIEYIEITSDANILKMEDSDSILLQRLLDLKNTVQNHGQGKLYSILSQSIENLLYQFYDYE